MHFSLSEEQNILYNTAREFGENTIAPNAIEQSGSASDYKVRRDTTQTCTAVPAFIDAMDFYCRVNFPRSSHGWGTGQMLWCQGGSSSSYLGFSAEL